MPRQASISIENNFSKGLITEATGLNFPENACTETYDCVFDKTGEVSRRLGIQLEEGFEVNTIDSLDESAITEFVWKSVALSGELTFFVMQRGRIISFWEIDGDGIISPNLKTFFVNLDGYKITGSPDVSDVNVSFSSGNGLLLIAHPYCDPISVRYIEEDDDIDHDRLSIKVRDMSGVLNTLDANVDEGEPIAVDLRPSAISGYIMYNYLNQGWEGQHLFSNNRQLWGGSTPLLAVWRYGVRVHPNWQNIVVTNTLHINETAYVYGRNDWPSEADFWTVYKRPIIPILDSEGNPLFPSTPDEAFALWATDEENLGNSPASKGHFIYDAFRMDRWTKATSGPTYNQFPELFNGLTAVPDETSGYARPSQIAFYAGRVWYAGVDAPKYNTRIYFSKIVENNLHADECYQQNDPTASDAPSSDLLPSDGGVVVIPDVAKVIKLVPFGGGLLVFASNGIWQIAGAAAGAGFTATDYGVVKVSEVGAISALNFINADGTPLWWNSDGVYSIKQDNIAPPQAISLSNTTIQRFFDDIPVVNRRWAKGAYNKNTKTVQWLYRSTEVTNVQERYHYDRILNLDLNTGAFYPWTISDSCLYVSGIAILDGFGATRTEENVTDVGVVVTDDGDNVTDGVLTLTDISSRFKYITFNECDDVDPGEEDTAATLVHNRNFLGELDSSDLSIWNYEASHNGVILGEDGVFYIPTSTESTFGTGTIQRSALQKYDGTGSVVYYDMVQFTNDMNSAVGITQAGSTFTRRGIIPVPFTQYFYHIGSGQSGLNFYLVFGLYKVNASGTIEFVNAAQAYLAGAGITFSVNGIVSVDYDDFTETDALDRPLVFVLSDSTMTAAVLRLPSVNDFILDTGNIGVYADIHTGFTAGSIWDIRGSTYNNEAPNNGTVFFLPTSGGTLLCKYVDWATAQAHIDNYNAGHSSPVIDGLAPSYPTGFVMATPITGASWSVINSSFRGNGGGALVPFADVLLDRDDTDPGFASDNFKNDWFTPTHQYDSSDDVHYLVWTRRYRPVEANQTNLGTYRKVLIQTWNPSSQIATFQAEEAGSIYDTVVDLGGTAARYGSYPKSVMSFLDTDFNEVYMYSIYDGTSVVTNVSQPLAKFGDFTPAVIADVPEATMAFSEFSNGDLIDWPTVTVGFDYDSYFISGYKVRGEALRKWQSNYWQVHTRNDTDSDPSVFDVYGRWDYARSGNTGRWNSVQRVTMPEGEYDFQTKRLKMRGHGKALQFKVNSVEQEPFNIVGWTIMETTNAAP